METLFHFILTLTCFIHETTEDSSMWMTAAFLSVFIAASASTSMEGRGRITRPSLHVWHIKQCRFLNIDQCLYSYYLYIKAPWNTDTSLIRTLFVVPATCTCTLRSVQQYLWSKDTSLIKIFYQIYVVPRVSIAVISPGQFCRAHHPSLM